MSQLTRTSRSERKGSYDSRSDFGETEHEWEKMQETKHPPEVTLSDNLGHPPKNLKQSMAYRPPHQTKGDSARSNSSGKPENKGKPSSEIAGDQDKAIERGAVVSMFNVSADKQ